MSKSQPSCGCPRHAVVAHDELPDLGFCARSVTPEGVRLALPLAGLVDAQTERARLEKEIAKHEKALHQLLEVVNRPGFAERAAPEVVAEKQEQRLALENQLAALRETLATLAEKTVRKPAVQPFRPAAAPVSKQTLQPPGKVIL